MCTYMFKEKKLSEKVFEDVKQWRLVRVFTHYVVCGSDKSVFEKAFDITLENNKIWMPGCLSRKKQIIPFLEPAFK